MSDNRYFEYGCPPLMNDGRFISNYVRSSTFDQYIRNMNNINTTHEFRHYIQKNGTNIINNLKAFHHEHNTCSVEGRCLPIKNNKNVLNGSGFLETQSNNKPAWYEELLDDEYSKPEKLDFMMKTNDDSCNLDTCK